MSFFFGSAVVVGISKTKSAQSFRSHGGEGGIEGRGGLALTASPHEARGAGTAQLSQPRDEGALAVVQAVARHRAG